MPRFLAPVANELSPDYSIEVTIRDSEAFEAAVRVLPPGSEVFIADLPQQEPGLLLEAAGRYRGAGFRPVPHLVARNLESEDQFRHLLDRLVRDAGVERVLVLGGDRERPAGPYADALALLETGLLREHGIREIAVACFPEGHPRISREALDRALDAKLQVAERDGLDVLMVSQFVFEAEPLLDYAAGLRNRGIVAPLRVGVAGPADLETLVRFGKELGAGPSMAALETPSGASGQSDVRTPGDLLASLQEIQDAASVPLFEKLHFFAFGSTASTIGWAEAQRALGR
jgi:methylenetetrahydrofolate reductase (NADPH)